MTGRKGTAGGSEESVVRIGHKIFSDGTILDVVRNTSGELKLLIWDGKSAKTAAQFAREGQTFAPLRIDPKVLPQLQMPGDIAEYGSTRKLFAEISAFISRATQQPPKVVQALTIFVFATWLIDPLPRSPCLWIVAPPTTTVASLMQVLDLLCRRAVFVNEISAAAPQSLFIELQPTVLTEVFQPTRRLLNSLRSSIRRGALHAPGGEAVGASCAKIVFAHESLRDPSAPVRRQL